MPTFDRYVAIGDSSTEGLDDPDGRGRYRGWADRLAEHVARAQPTPLHYANLAIRGRKTRQVLDEQLAPALAMRPDLASCFTGTNDVIRTGFDLDAVRADVGTMWGALRAAGATVVSITLPDLADVIPFARHLSARVLALNAMLRALAREQGVILVDLAAHPMASDPRVWSGDRLHANSLGHERIAAALAQALGIPGADDSWAAPLPPRPTPTMRDRVRAELRWGRSHLLPWAWRHLRGHSSGDGITSKRPELTTVPRA